MLLTILATLFIAVRSERYKEELDAAIRETQQTGLVLDGLIRSTYSMSIEEAVDEIKKMQSNLTTLIVWLSKDLNGDESKPIEKD